MQAYNQLDGPIPAGLWLGPNIKTVYLDHNLLDGPVPPTWNIPTGSQSYYLQENKLDGGLDFFEIIYPPPQHTHTCIHQMNECMNESTLNPHPKHSLNTF